MKYVNIKATEYNFEATQIVDNAEKEGIKLANVLAKQIGIKKEDFGKFQHELHSCLANFVATKIYKKKN